MALVLRSLAPVAAFMVAGALAACGDAHAVKNATESEDAGSPDAGPVVGSYDVGTLGVHRLNAAEYDNTVRDLLGDMSQPAKGFPPDDGADSFTNIADALTVSPLLFEKYETAAENLAATSVLNPAIVGCPSAQPADDCVASVMSRFLPRAFRRPVGAEEVSRYVRIAQGQIAAGGSVQDGQRAALQAALLSPSFLFRIESDPKVGDTTPHVLDDYALASRLSYFLWSSMPDDVLFEYAKAGKLSSPDVFDRQVKRMLDDPKAQTLVDGFAVPWLLHAFEGAAPDPTLYPQWSDELRADMKGETRAFLALLRQIYLSIRAR